MTTFSPGTRVTIGGVPGMVYAADKVFLTTGQVVPADNAEPYEAPPSQGTLDGYGDLARSWIAWFRSWGYEGISLRAVVAFWFEISAPDARAWVRQWEEETGR